MNSSSRISDSTRLPITGSLLPFYSFSLVIAALLVAVSVAGLVYPSHVYPTQELLESALPNDAINLAVGLPILILSMWLTRRHKLVGLLFWPGALMFVVYNCLARVIDLPLGWGFVANLALLALSVYTLLALAARIDAASVQRRLDGAVPARLSAVILVGFGILFMVRAAALLATALIGGTALADTELSVLVTDVLLSPAGSSAECCCGGASPWGIWAV